MRQLIRFKKTTNKLMAERNPRIPHSIQTLLYVERRGKYCGYKPELITDTISYEWNEFLICSECKGISRRARHVGGNTVCEMCVTGTAGNLDERVENKVSFLNSRCPLSINGCDWEGVLGEIEQHMDVCTKVLVECPLKCGIVFERETTEQHNREVCPLRMIECQYCKEEIQVNREKQHVGECVNHPDTEVLCPYKELGCYAIVLRKNKDIHLTENMIGHQKLVLDQLNQLRNRNQQLELQQKNMNQEQTNRIWTIGRSATEREREQRGDMDTLLALIRKVAKKWKLSIIFSILISITIIIIGLISIPVAVVLEVQQSSQIQSNLQQIQSNNESLKSNLQQIQSNNESLKSNLQLIQSNNESLKSNLQQIQSNLQQIQSNLQLIQSLMVNVEYIYYYNETRGRVLQGIEWIHYLSSEDQTSGPIFYLDKCKLILEEQTLGYDSQSNMVNAQYSVKRLEYENYNDYYCAITHINASIWNLEDMQSVDTYTHHLRITLDVGDSVPISDKFGIVCNTKIRLRVYFDTERIEYCQK